MAVHERSKLCFYFAQIQTNVERCPVHAVGLVEEAAPFHRGKGLVFPGRPFEGLVFGLWFRPWRPNNEQGADRWFDPKWLDLDPEEISTWRNGAEESLVEED